MTHREGSANVEQHRGKYTNKEKHWKGVVGCLPVMALERVIRLTIPLFLSASRVNFVA